jgi:hypothetical protein
MLLCGDLTCSKVSGCFDFVLIFMWIFWQIRRLFCGQSTTNKNRERHHRDRPRIASSGGFVLRLPSSRCTHRP